ncbi:glycosyltransferase [Nocardia brasiliensis]|uniref:4,4'-diaponeurosporenoate glycosyltransferase n=1 Tax=Nocardia brasiliensis (strain ATCC 700358 / HUJEG-1) TaxID=1133849 RepID=K0F0N1_NOCB7|nr:glycosyltransferase [Nocardia brasiliensis]AFU02974.1 glycosyltransferase [Nocardia brasiliensis ATCC 700358]OCF86042.1 hypothetical protein AW168_33325 [Nocardia brasiliensis]
MWSRVEVAESVRPSAVVVVVPVHNEQHLLRRCLASVEVAASNSDVPVRVVVVLDACTDGSARLVPASMDIVEVGARSVGAARAAGFAYAATHFTVPELARVWYSSTDADSVVPPDWFSGQLVHASAADVVLGTVAVGWGEHPAPVRAEFERRYLRHGCPGRGHHGHIHGANLGLRADWYHRVGGFAPLAVHEDVDLVTRLQAAGARVAWVDRPAVTTSDRRDNRVPGGFGGYLTALAGDHPESA